MTARLAKFLTTALLMLTASSYASPAEPDFSTLFSRSNIPMLLIEPASGNIVKANAAAAKFYGYSQPQLQQKNIAQINTLSPAQINTERQLAKQEKRHFFLFRHRLADGTLKPVAVYSRPYQFHGQTLLLSMVIDRSNSFIQAADNQHYQQRLEQLVDAKVAEVKQLRNDQTATLIAAILVQMVIILALFITARRYRRLRNQYRTTEALQRSIMDAASTYAFITTDTDGIISSINSSAERMLGYSAEELVGKATPAILHVPEELEQRRAELRVELNRPVTDLEVLLGHIKQKGIEKRHWTHRHKNGHTFPVALTVTPIFNAKGLLSGYLGVTEDISHRQAREKALRDSQRLYHSLVAALSEGVVTRDKEGQVLAYNDAALTMLGLTAEQLLASSWPELASGAVHEDMRPFAADQHPSQVTVRTGRPLVNVVMGMYVKEQLRWLSGNTVPLLDENTGQPYAVVTTFVDITERKYNETQLQLAASVFENSYEGIMICDAENRIIDVNPAFTRITGYEPEEICGQDPSILASGLQGQHFYDDMWQCLQQSGSWRGEIWNRRKSGEVYAELLAISMVRDAQGQLKNYIGVFSDISQIKAHETELAHIAHYDPLTGLPNRRLLNELLSRAMLRAERNSERIAICFIDLDGFKPVNDQYGHQAGDRLLVEIAQRLQNVLRQSDTVSRLGGDEFVVLLSEEEHHVNLVTPLERLMNAIRTPVVIDGHKLQVSASIGVTLFPDDNADADILLRHADQAMYQAKQAGKNQFRVFDVEASQRADQAQSGISRLHQAIINNEMCLFYQPKVDLNSGEIIGAEALIRWQHPEQGLRLPGDFLPNLLGSELDIILGNWVMDHACAQLASWYDQGWQLTLSINISAAHLLSHGFIEHLKEVMARYPQVPKDALELEIVETATLHDLNLAARVLHQSRLLGVRTALDDFGTGYASLTYLRRLPIDTLKIDQSFVRDMLDDPNDLSIVENIINMAYAFNRSVIAEGVESIEHARLLRQLGCRLAQGYGIAKPMPAGQFEQWRQQWLQDPKWRSETLPALHPLPALRAAKVAHQKWSERVMQCIGAEQIPEDLHLDPHHCGFGQWYATAGMAQYGTLSRFKTIRSLHDNVHRLAAAVITDNGQDAALQAQFAKARDLLLIEIDTLIDTLTEH